MPKLDLSAIGVCTGSSYPAPHDAAMVGRSLQALGDAGGLKQFGVNLVRLAPGAMSALRHWHVEQDEFVMVLEGALTLIEDAGETLMRPGDSATFPAGRPDGHHLVNRTETEGAFVVVGTRTETETGWYPDFDLRVEIRGGVPHYTRRDGSALNGTAAAPPDPDFAALSEALTGALLAGDPEAYAALHALPMHVAAHDGDAYRIATRTALDADFRLYVQALRLNRVSDIFRVEKLRTRTAPDRIDLRAEVHLLAGASRIVAPYTVVFTLVHSAGDWRIARVESALNHVKWRLGRAGLPPNGRFETGS
jgi:uncharacterized cupin superfamily protein